MVNIESFMQEKVEADTSYNFQKLYAPFWFIVYYVIGYPLRVLGCFADGFVIYGLVYAARESTWQSVVIAFIGSLIIQVMLGESATITAKNLFRGLFYRSLAYGMMMLVTLMFTGGSLYSTIFLSKKGSVHAVESFSPTLKTQSLEKDKTYNDDLIKSKEAKNEAELSTIKSEAKTAQNEVKTQISKMEKMIVQKQKIVNSYVNKVEAPWEHREAIIKGQRQLITLNNSLGNLIQQEKTDLADARKRHGKTIVLAEQSKINDVNATIAENERKQEKLALFGLIAMGANVGINILSFLIMWGFELYLKFAQGGGSIEKPRKRRSDSESESETTPDNESETESETTVNAESKAETFEDQRFQSDVKKTVSETVSKNNSERETDSKMATILQLETQFFPYEKHVRNARQSFRRAFEENRKPKTIQNRMATAQQHINILLFEGFNVWIDSKTLSLLRFDKLKNPTLKPKNWEAVVKMKNGLPSLEKFEVETVFNENLGEVG
jgi:cytoskeletal protein RodZ